MIEADCASFNVFVIDLSVPDNRIDYPSFRNNTRAVSFDATSLQTFINEAGIHYDVWIIWYYYEGWNPLLLFINGHEYYFKRNLAAEQFSDVAMVPNILEFNTSIQQRKLKILTKK